MKKLAWTTSEQGFVLDTALLRLYVEPKDGAWGYQVAGQYLLRWSQKPIASVEEAKSKAIRAARTLLKEQAAQFDESAVNPSVPFEIPNDEQS